MMVPWGDGRYTVFMDNMVKGMDSWLIVVDSQEAEKLAGTAFDKSDDEIEKVYLNMEC